MKYEKELKNGQVIVNISIEGEEWEGYITKSYQKNKGKYAIQGFRKGFAPQHVLEKAYGEGIFMEGALDEAANSAFIEFLKENKDVKPMVEPEFSLKKFERSGVELVLNIIVEPEFELATYKGLEFKKETAQVKEEDIKTRIDRDLLRASRLVETNAPVKTDDTVTLDFEGFVDGKAFEGGKAENYQLKIGSHSFIDTFEDQLIGLNIGDEKDVNVTFPAEYHEKKLASKPAVFKVKIHAIRERQMPELNDEFVENNTDFNTVDEYKENVKKELEERNKEHADLELDNKILDAVVENTTVELPETLINREKQRIIDGIKKQLARQGASLEDYAKYIGKTVEEITQEQTAGCEKQLKGRLVLEKLIKVENLELTAEDIDTKLAEEAGKQNITVDEFKTRVGDNGLNRLASELVMSKLIKFLRENNTIVE